MKVWIDMTASAHPLVFRPLVERLQARGDEVEITARDYAQTLQLIEQHGMTATPIGHHGGRSRAGKARQLASRLAALKKWAKGRDFDIALAHGSHELTITAHRLGIPSSTTFDYEWAWLQHQLGCRAATKVVVPDSIPVERLARYGAEPPKLLQYPGLKEEYYLSDFEPDPGVAPGLGVDPERTLVVLRPPPDVSLYHRHSNPLFPQTLQHLGRLENVHAVVIPRTEEQRDYVRSLELPSVIVPDEAVDAQSLIAIADLVVSAGGTMNREAAALGVPVYTTYGGRLGGVDEELIRQGRLRPLTDPRALELEKRGAVAPGPRPARPSARCSICCWPRCRATELRGRARPRAPRRRSARAWPARRRRTDASSDSEPRLRVGDRGENRVVEDDVRGNLLGSSPAACARRRARRTAPGRRRPPARASRAAEQEPAASTPSSARNGLGLRDHVIASECRARVIPT